MRPSFLQRYRFSFLIVGVLVCLVAVFQGSHLVGGYFLSTHVNTPTPGTSVSLATTPTSTPTPVSAQPAKRHHFEAGITLPQWRQDAYGQSDTPWQRGIRDIRAQTGAGWIEMTILFFQDSLTSTQVTIQPTTPSVTSVTDGIRTAHALGYHVFLVPLITITNGPEHWSGRIHFDTQAQEQQWFDSYWQVLQPYAVAAAKAGAEQFAIGTEDEWLQQNAPDPLWHQFIARMRSVFPGTLTYDINWTSLNETPPAWMRDPNLNMIGASAYQPLASSRQRVDPHQMFALWRDKVKRVLDKLAIRLGKPIFISEIGYRNSADALYRSWEPQSSAPPDPAEQAAACEATLANVIPDRYIKGIFFWGWDDVGAFKLSGQPAVTVLHKWYTLSHS